MDLLIPLSRFHVNYEIGAGRPYSGLDRLVLAAVAQGARTVEALADIFQLPRRLLIEVLVTLARAGWVAIDIVQGGFTITQPGHSAVEKGEIPPFSFSRKAEETLLMECCSGALISQRDGISYTNEFALRQSGQWEKIQRLPVSFFDDRLDLGQVLPLLSHDAGEWIRWIDAPVLISRGRHWLLVRVNPQKQSVQWLPERWQHELGPMLLARAKGASQPVPLAMATERLEIAAVGEEAVLESEDLLLTRADHRECLRAALGEAKSTVLIASAFLNTVALESEIRQWILDALRRGVQVDLLWGYAASHSDQPAKVALRWLRELRKDARQMAGLLRFSSQPTESHAKLLICDPPSGHCAYVGSLNWLSMPLKDDTEDAPGSNITLRLRHPKLVANLCRTAAGLWMTSRAGQISDAPERLRRLAATLDQEQTMPPPAEPQGKPVATCRISIVRDRDHEALLRDILLHNDKRVLLLSHKLGPIAGTRLASWQPANNDATPRLITFFGESTIDPDVLDKMRAELEPLGIQFHQTTHLHAKVLATSQRAVISSYNFLSADPFGAAARAREVGILVEGGEVPKLLLERFFASSNLG